MIVVDASVVLNAVADDGAHGRRSRQRIQGEERLAPHLVDVEVLHAIRRLTRQATLAVPRAARAIRSLEQLDITRSPHRALLHRAWDLRGNLTGYDAVYVALAETMDASLVTWDARLARAPGIRCHVEVLATPD